MPRRVQWFADGVEAAVGALHTDMYIRQNHCRGDGEP